MPRAQRLTRRFPAKLSEAAYRRLRRFAAESDLSEGEALSFLLENIDHVMADDNFPQRLRLHQAWLTERREKGAND